MDSKETNEKYIMHICHPSLPEIYFGISHFDNPQWLIGYGSGNMLS